MAKSIIAPKRDYRSTEGEEFRAARDVKELGFTPSSDGTFAPDLNEHLHIAKPEKEFNYQLPYYMSSVFGDLESYAESKYSREHLKICAFYNKFFPTLDQISSYNGATYNVIPFTTTDNEIVDAGTGIAKNYLKACIDTVVARLKNITFDVRIQSASPLVLLEMYHTQIERYFKSQIKTNRLEHVVTECFHDAAILGYSHVFMDPWSKKVRKVNDWQVGFYEPEFENHDLRRLLIKDNAFPVGSLGPYVQDLDPDTIKRLVQGREHIELTLFMDCFSHKKIAMIDGTVTPPSEYPFENCLLVSYIWDIGIKRCTTTSLFDLLFPLQRQINKLCAKLTTMYLNYKGTVPVISTAGDVDMIAHQLNNKSGEVLILSGAVADVTKMIGQIDPIPMNPTFGAEIEALKANMLELAGVQEISMNLDNLRSAAAVVALDQLRDTRFESQIFRMAEFVQDMLENIVRFNAGLKEESADVPWEQMLDLIQSTYLEIIPIHGNDPEEKPIEEPEDFQLYAVDQFIIDVLNGRKTAEDRDYSLNPILLKKQCVNKLLRFKALKGNYQYLEELAVMLFIEDVRNGTVDLAVPAESVNPAANSQATNPDEMNAEGGGEESGG